jgi:DNA-binding Xre family transcriptional regulator
MKIKVVIKIKELIEKHELSIRALSRITKIRHATLSDLSNNKRKNINLSHIERIADALNIKDIREIIDIVNVK